MGQCNAKKLGERKNRVGKSNYSYIVQCHMVKTGDGSHAMFGSAHNFQVELKNCI